LGGQKTRVITPINIFSRNCWWRFFVLRSKIFRNDLKITQMKKCSYQSFLATMIIVVLSASSPI